MNDLKIAKKMVSTCKSAQSRNIPFDISYKKMKQLLTRKTCYYTGVRFDDKNIRSIDRVDNEKGYIDSNVVVCTIEINQIKNNLTVTQIRNLHNKVSSFLKK